MVDLGLNSHHQAQLLSYMKFAQYLRGQSLKSVEHAFSDASAGLFDDTYTQEEVKVILKNLKGILSCDMEGEMCSFAHNNVLMLQQLFKQAEHWHLRLEIQLSELQNRELLEVIQLLEADETLVKAPVEKTTEESSIALLRMEIERLRTENQRLQDQQLECADKLEQTQEDLSVMTKNLNQAAVEMQNYRTMSQPSPQDTQGDSKMVELGEKLQQVELLLQTDKESSRKRQSALMSELNSTKEQVAQVQAQLQLAELELERKFSETKVYANMKQILMKKNGQIRRLRNRLQELAGNDDDSGADDEDEGA